MSKRKKKNMIAHTTSLGDSVNHPKHYNSHPSGIECIEVVRHYNFNVGNVIKYLWRHGLKHEQGMSDRQKALEDLRKARFYLDDEIKKLEQADKETYKETDAGTLSSTLSINLNELREGIKRACNAANKLKITI